jgi:hypothetical protein
MRCFRDAHGFIVGQLRRFCGGYSPSGASSLLAAGAHASGMAAAALASNASSRGATDNVRPYDLDTLFRTTPGTEAKPGASGAREETGHILARGLVTGEVSAADRTYLAQMVAAQTGLSDADAKLRVDEGLSQMKAAADAHAARPR